MNEFETAVVNEPSVFEPLEFNCIYMRYAMWPSASHLTLSYSEFFVIFVS